MTETRHGIRTPLMQRVLDGGRTWGSLDVSNSRYGVTRYRLVVFPPGISRDERVLLRLWRSLPAWGIATWLTLEIVLMTLLSPGATLAISTAACVAAGVAVMALAGSTRGRVRTLTVVRMTGVTDTEGLVALHRLGELATRLTTADTRLADGEMTAVEHEAEVWRAYDEMREMRQMRQME